MVCKCFDKKAFGSSIKKRIFQTKNQLKNYANQLHKLNWRKVQSFFIHIIWVADAADMQLINKFDKEIQFLLCVIDSNTKYAWVKKQKR